MPPVSLLLFIAVGVWIAAIGTTILSTVAVLIYLRLRGWNLPMVQMDLATLAMRRKASANRIFPDVPRRRRGILSRLRLW